MMPIFTFDFTGSINLTVSDLWPDGDAPANPTVLDVAKLIAKCGGLHNVIHDWNLDPNIALDITGAGGFTRVAR